MRWNRMETSNIVIIVTGLSIAIVLSVVAEFIVKTRTRNRDPIADRQQSRKVDECEATREDESTSACVS